MTTAPDLERLAPAELRQLRFVLSVLSLHQLVHLAALVKRVCTAPGFGRIAIVIDKARPSMIEAGQSEKFLACEDAGRLDELMKG